MPNDATLLLDELNRRIEDADAAVGPSYLMDERIYKRSDGLELIWQYQIMPLLEDLFYGQPDLDEQYGLVGLCKAIDPQPYVGITGHRSLPGGTGSTLLVPRHQPRSACGQWAAGLLGPLAARR